MAKPLPLVWSPTANPSPTRRRRPLPEARWYRFSEVGEAFELTFEPGRLKGLRWLTADFVLAGNTSVRFQIQLFAGDRVFRLAFGLLAECQARLRFPLAATDQGAWLLEREAALLKPQCWDDAVDPALVTRVRFSCTAKAEPPLDVAMTPLVFQADEPERVEHPRLPRGKLIDRLGQDTLREWPTKSRTAAEVTARLRFQERAPQRWPNGFSPWGGWSERRFEATGWFRTHNDGRRWWLVDPDGHAFWSAGVDCVRVDTDAKCEGLSDALTWTGPARGNFVNYLEANLRRAFGSRWYARWAGLALGSLKALGFNTVGNWSEWEAASQAGFPYVRPLEYLPDASVPMVFRDFPDVEQDAFEAWATHFAQQLASTCNDKALVGYFLMNEPQWGFAAMTPAEGLWRDGRPSACRSAFDRFLKGRAPTPADFEAFSSRLVEKLYSTLSKACRAVDPHHLNLGARYYTVPPDWALAGMTGFDVFSLNCYRERVVDLTTLCARLGVPALVGEWHFGALDVGLAASGIGRVATQADRGRAYRVYVEDAAQQPWCVGTHWFTLYDQSSLGRFDGENYQIGLFDVTHRPYEPMTKAVVATHARLYAVAAGTVAPFSDAPETLLKIFY